ncbi:MAG: RimK family alpha-L-glutamate ligase [Clostridia bacterium]|nr:RimK family alpha-L-glutamate ligase [Clostridia bacterium]
MKGWLIVNGFLKSAAFDRLYDRLIEAASGQGVLLDKVTNDALFPFPDAIDDAPDFALLWDKDVRLGARLRQAGVPVFNAPESIAVCDDKTLTYLALLGKVPMPETCVLPLTFAGYSQLDFLRGALDRLGLPCVLKEGVGSFGEQVYLIQSLEEAEAHIARLSGRPLLLQRFIRESAGRDVRVYVAGDRCVAAMERIAPPGNFRANQMGGGTAVPHRITREEEELALHSVQELGLTFGGVDLLAGEDGPLLCEVNSNAHFSALEKITGVSVAREIIRAVIGESS